MYDSTKPDAEEILKIVKSTWKEDDIPGSTDGIGNKGYYHWMQKTFGNAVLDALGMTLNDAGAKRFEVRYLQNHMMLPRDDRKAKVEIVSCLAEECRKRNISIISGETAIHEHSDSLEISVSVSGDRYIDKKPNRFENGDYLVGVESGGLMSNGFTKIREIFGDEFRKEFVKPTLIYYDAIIGILKKGVEINGMSHMTGGAFAKLKRLIDKDADVLIGQNSHFEPGEIFREIYSKGVSDGEMYRTFNCGIGFILSVPKHSIEDIISGINLGGFRADVIGRVTKGNGNVKIHSAFSDREIIF